MKIHLISASLTLALMSAVSFTLRAEDAVKPAPEAVNAEAVTVKPVPSVVKTDGKIDNELLATIRKSIVDDKALSTSAHNIKLDRDNDTLTLKGTVASDAEKSILEQKVAAYVGAARVVNLLDVDKK